MSHFSWENLGLADSTTCKLSFSSSKSRHDQKVLMIEIPMSIHTHKLGRVGHASSGCGVRSLTTGLIAAGPRVWHQPRLSFPLQAHISITCQIYQGCWIQALNPATNPAELSKTLTYRQVLSASIYFPPDSAPNDFHTVSHFIPTIVL